MKMQNPLIMRISNLLWKQNSTSKILGNLSSNEIPLSRSNCRILIGVFLSYLHIIISNQRKDGIIGRICLSNQGSLIAVDNILLGKFCFIKLDQLHFNKILNFFNWNRPFFCSFQSSNNFLNYKFARLFCFWHFFISLLDCNVNFFSIISHFWTISLDYLLDCHLDTKIKGIKKTWLSPMCISLFTISCVYFFVQIQDIVFQRKIKGKIRLFFCFLIAIR